MDLTFQKETLFWLNEPKSYTMEENKIMIAHLFEAENEIQIGIYACSPEHSAFKAVFTDTSFTECQWKEYE